jgi:Kelch motif
MRRRVRNSVKRRRFWLSAIAVAVVLAGCGAGSTSPRTRSAQARRPAHGDAPVRVVRSLAVETTGELPAAVQWPATVAVGGRLLLMGGLDQDTASMDEIFSAGPNGSQQIGTLPYAVHDAAGASLGATAYLIGGGEPSYSDILAVTSNGRATVAGHLPAAASDVAAGVLGNTVYVVGGYTGTAPLDTIVAWSGLGTGRVVAQLPHPVRYAAVAALDGRLIIAGGTSGDQASRDIYSFHPTDGHLQHIGLLPRELTHAAAAGLGDRVYVIGGRGGVQGSQTTAILAIDPLSGRVTPAGRLPVALSDVGAATIGSAAMVVGGRESSGTLSRQVYLLRPRAGTS